MFPKILFIGDVMPGENHYHFGRGIRTLYGYDYTKFISEKLLKSIFHSELDAVVYNFEYSLVDELFDFKEINTSVYSAPNSSLNIFPDGIEKIVNIANNHFSEHGILRTQNTIKIIKDRGFTVIGESSYPVEKEIHGKKFLFWGVSMVPDKDNTGLYFKSSHSNLLKELFLPDQKCKDDVWIISIHWGSEYCFYPDKEQQVLGHRLVDRGFDVVYGHHPHVYQPFETHKNSIILYSVGNFIFDQNFSKRTQRGLCVEIGFHDDNTSIEKAFVLENKNYKPRQLRVINNEKVSYNGKTHKKIEKKIIQYYYRVLMKVELLHDLNNLSDQTYKYLINKVLSVIKKYNK